MLAAKILRVCRRFLKGQVLCLYILHLTMLLQRTGKSPAKYFKAILISSETQKKLVCCSCPSCTPSLFISRLDPHYDDLIH